MHGDNSIQQVEDPKFRIHEAFDIDEQFLTSPEQLSEPHCIQLFYWWQKQQASPDEIPSWQSFDILDHIPLAPMLTVTRRVDPDHFEFVVRGEQVLEMFQQERIPKSGISRDHPNKYQAALFDYYETIFADAQPRRCIGHFRVIDREYINFESIDLPFKGHGDTVERVLSLLCQKAPAA